MNHFLSIALATLLPCLVLCRWYQPSPGTTFHFQMTGKLDMAVHAKVYIVDMDETPRDTIEKLQDMRKKVICHFSAGTFETWRMDSDFFLFHWPLVGHRHHIWSDIHWLDITNENVKLIMTMRLNRAVRKGCDGVELSSLGGYMQDTGFPITYEDQLNYNIWLAEEAHRRNLTVGFTNNIEQIEDLVPYYDFVVNDMCNEFSICDALYPFVSSGKAVFGIEYRRIVSPHDFCPIMNLRGFSWLQLFTNLNASRIDCQDVLTWG